MPATQALIFDVDGTLADTEREGHLPACNDAFAELGFSVRWTSDEFRGLLPMAGNAARMRRALARLEGGLDPGEIDAAGGRLVELKRRFYVER